MSNSSSDNPPNAHRVPLIVISIVFTLVGTSIVLARLYIRGIATKALGRDDAIISLAWVASIGFFISSCVGLRYGAGLRNHNEDVSQSIKAAFFAEMFYYVAIYLIKLSILVFYLRLVNGLFGKFYNCTRLCIAILTCHFVSTVVVAPLQCRPLSAYWNHNQPGSCINIPAFFYSTSGFTIASDLVIIGLPLPTLFKVNRSRSEKFSLTAVFGAGALSTLASCIRLYSVSLYTLSKDPLCDVGPMTFWSFIEINLGITCASGPALKVCYNKIKNSIFTPSQSKHSGQSLGPTESQVEFGLRFLQPTPRRRSSTASLYEIDVLTGKLKGTSSVLGASPGHYEDPTYLDIPHNNGDIMVHKTFETCVKKMHSESGL